MRKGIWMRTEPNAPRLIVKQVEAGVRPVRLRLPFRFGAHTLTACPQLFVRVVAEVEGFGQATGWAAELMVPKWFDKRPDRDPAQNVEDLASAVTQAAEAYRGGRPATAFGLFERHYAALQTAGASQDMTALSTSFGQAVLDRAVLDALCRALGLCIFDAVQRNAIGLGDSPLVPDMSGHDWSTWLAQRQAGQSIEARHTIGLLDELDTQAFDAQGLPLSLRAAIQLYGHRCFKIKLGGEPQSDLQRLQAILQLLETAAPGFRYTLDGNEQYANPAALRLLAQGLRTLTQPLYLEQPIPRDQSLTAPITLPEGAPPLLLDEADGTLDAFVQAREAGWLGVSSKACKGFYKALINRARCDRWNSDAANPRYFMSAEDLTCQAGLALQQDLALVALLGLDHSERNGHHYGDGLASAPSDERQAFLHDHPELYSEVSGQPRLRIEAGRINIDSLFRTGYAHRSEPDINAMQPLSQCSALL